MTLRQLAERRVTFYRRSTWEPGQFVHIDSLLQDNKTGEIRGYAACFCKAPIPGHHPDCDDDLWLEYAGPECAHLLAISLPDLLDSLLEGFASGRAEAEREAVRDQVPDVSPFQIGGEMRA